MFGLYREGFSHLIISALHRHLKVATSLEDSFDTKAVAAKLFLDIVGGSVDHDDRIAVKIIEVFDVRLTDIETVMVQLMAQKKYQFDSAKAFIERYIFGLIESHSYMLAVSLLEHFSIRQSGESFLFKMIESKEFRAAEKWATFMGKPLVRLLVQEYADRNKLKFACEIMNKNHLRQEFPDLYHKCKERYLDAMSFLLFLSNP